ncbi:MAG: hypothetical protein JWO57_797 [Pseudonocardiales bacterium]|nr:hypothetical protein [Pseudonocardiales bacterium]
MAKLQFRITNIRFDDEEEVAELTAVVRDDAYTVITGIVGEVNTLNATRGGTEMTIALPADNAMRLYGECGQMTGLDPRREQGGHEIWDSLNWVYCSLMDEG